MVKRLLLVGAACFPLVGCFGEYSEAISYGESQIKEALKDPDSAKFSDVWFSPDANNGKPRTSGYVCGKVNAKNAIGGYAGDSAFVIYVGQTDSGFVSSSAVISQDSEGPNMTIITSSCKK